MGADQSTIKQKKYQNFTILGLKENQTYGAFKLIEVEHQLFAMIHKNCQNYQEFCTLSAKLNQSKQLNTIPNMIKLVEVDTNEESNLCSTFYRVTAIYEYFENTLRNVGHLNMNTLKSLVSTLNQLYHNGGLHGCLTPDFIMVDSNGEIKINNVQAMTNYNHYKRVLVQQQDTPWYLAPEQLDALNRRELRPHFDTEKCDIYSLALTILELYSKCDIQLFYNKEQLISNQYAIDAALDCFGQSNGAILKNVVKQMLQLDPRMRPTFSELSQYLQPLNDTEEQQTEEIIEQHQEQQLQQIEPKQELEVYEQQEQQQHHQDVQKDEEYENIQPQFQESPHKVSPKKYSTHRRIDSENQPICTQPINKPSIPQSPKDYYVSGSIAAQFNKSQDYCQQNVATAFFQESVEVLQERCTNQDQQQQSMVKDTLNLGAKKKSVPNKVMVSNKKNVSIKRPKHEAIETKLPKQAVVVNKRR